MSRAFTVLTDSTADIVPELAAERGITVVPLSVTIDGRTLPDGTLTQEQFFEAMGKSPTLPTTSQPSVGTFVEAYRTALESAENVLSVHISSKLSGTVEAARQAAAQFGDRVHVFDSKNLSWGLAFQVMEAAKAAVDGADVHVALERLKAAREKSRLIVGLDSLHNLAKGGRIGRVSSFLGSVLDLKVTFTVDEAGSFAPLGRSRGEKAALRHTLEWVTKQVGPTGKASFAVGYALAQERAEWLRAELERRFEVVEMFVYPAGSVIATHTGTGWGVAVMPQE